MNKAQFHIVLYGIKQGMLEKIIPVKKIKVWLKKFGVTAIIFFLIKGLLWLYLVYFMIK
jgi:hypothetical protein